MNHPPRLNRVIRIARWTAVVGILSSAVTISIAARSAKTADNPMKWAADHKNALPKTLSEVAAYPADYRAWIFTEEPDAIRLTMVRQHAADLLASTRFQWSDEQRRFLQASLDMANSAKHFSDLPATCTEVQRLFPKGPMRDAVRTVGSETAAHYEFASLAISARLLGRQMIGWMAPVTVSAEEEVLTPYCNCHDGVCDNCGDGIACDLQKACRTGIGTCHTASFLCTGAHSCDGYTASCG
jgi:hypothetical protein